MAVLNISIDPSNIDINVHPTKTEVKFSDEKAVYDAVYYGVRGALYAIPNVPKIERAADEPVKIERDASKQLTLTDMVNALPRGAAQNRNNSFSDYFAGEKGKGKKSFSPSDAERSFDFGDRAEEINDNTAERAQNIPNAIHEDKIPKTLSVSSPKRKEEPLIPSRDGTPNENAGKAAAETTVFEDEYFEIIGQIFNTYIIAEKGDEMMIIDQHAAHERLKYEELLRELDSRSPFSQMLIEPVVVNLSASEMAAYRKNKKLFDETGFESEEFGGDSVIIRYAPGEIEMGEVEPLFSELVAQSEDMKHELIGDKYQRILYTIACKSAVKANMRMSVQEMESLVRNVLRLKNINTCPHGRPIIITMSKKEIEKEFKRIV